MNTISLEDTINQFSVAECLYITGDHKKWSDDAIIKDATVMVIWLEENNMGHTDGEIYKRYLKVRGSYENTNQ